MNVPRWRAHPLNAAFKGWVNLAYHLMPQHLLRVGQWRWLPYLLWGAVLLSSGVILVKNAGSFADTWLDQFIVSGISVVVATFVAWLIWDRSRNIRAAEEEMAAQKVRVNLFLQADGVLGNVMSYIMERLIGDFNVFGEAYKADVDETVWPIGMEEEALRRKPTFKHRISSLTPDELSHRISAFHRDLPHLMDQLFDVRSLAYTSAVSLRLDTFLKDWDSFVGEFDHYATNSLYVRNQVIPMPSIEQHRNRVIERTDFIYEKAVTLSEKLEAAWKESRPYR